MLITVLAAVEYLLCPSAGSIAVGLNYFAVLLYALDDSICITLDTPEWSTLTDCLP